MIICLMYILSDCVRRVFAGRTGLRCAKALVPEEIGVYGDFMPRSDYRDIEKELPRAIY